MERWLAPYSFHNFLIRGRDGRGQIEKTRFADSVRDVEMVVLPACSGSATHQASVSLARLTRFAQGQNFGFVGCARICASSPTRLPGFFGKDGSVLQISPPGTFSIISRVETRLERT
jgi:hypothetical protein